MGISLGRALRTRDMLKSGVIDAYSTARICHMTSEQLDARIMGVMSKAPKGTPQWALAYARGYRDALSAELYQSALVYGGYVDGVFYSTHRNRADYYETNGISPADYADNGRVTMRGHYWADDVSKPFFCGA